ncbi:hypothetical protein [Micromonospora sp. NPDC023888]|uniref:hypothetical protein n=1 Tax=Micromonospora sp. NPDC023888 TaxID=3155607 RepID=UPI0033D42275
MATAPTLLVELIHSVLTQVAPEELPTFDIARKRYLDDAANAVKTGRLPAKASISCSDDPLGSGFDIDSTEVLVGAVAYVCTAVVEGALSGATDQVKKYSANVATKAFRRLRRQGAASNCAREWTQDELAAIRQVALVTAVDFGLGERDSSLLADAIVEALRRLPT